MHQIAEILVCPNCKGQISEIEDTVRCQICGSAYEKNNGVYRFNDEEFYWGEIPKKKMQDLLSLLKERGFHYALETVIKSEYPELINSILDERRIIPFIPLLNLNNKEIAVDIGSGYGIASMVLSRFFNKVYSVEAVKERAEFINLISKERNRENITVVQANMHKLPFANNSCDLMMLIGVLEWAGLELLHKNPKIVQSFFIKNLFNILKPGGILFIGIENRFNFRYFLGEIDHSGLKYTSLLPRCLANLVFNIFQNKRRYFVYKSSGYRTYTYSYWGYYKLLRRCGFIDIKLLGCYPSYYRPKFISPFSQNFFCYSDIFKSKNIKTIMLHKIMNNHLLRKCLMPSFIIIAKKGV